MTNPNLTTTSPTYEDSFAMGGEDEAPHDGEESEDSWEGEENEVPHKGGEDEVPLDGEESEVSREGEEFEVPHEGGKDEVPLDWEESEVSREGEESEVPHEGGKSYGSVDEAPAVGQLVEGPSHVGVDVEAGPSGEQPLVVVQQAVTGGDDPPELCEYEKLRERNIRERDEAMKEAMEEIDEAKQDMRDNAPGAKKRAAEEEAGGKGKRKKVKPVLEVRRSGRERKLVNYVVDEDLDGRSRKRGRQMGGRRSNEVSKTPARSVRRMKITSKPDPPPTLSSSYECQECGKRFGYKGHVRTHFKMVHDEEKNYKCAKCGKQFSQSSILTQHIQTVHDKIRAFKCEQCGKSFGTAGGRKSHIESVHSKIRYPCTWQGCTHQAHAKRLLKYHVRKVHTKEWSFECKLCEDKLAIWWGCIHPNEMKKHRAKKHPVEWEEEQEAYRREHPFVCKYRRCLNRYKTEVEKQRHEVKMH